MPFFFILGLLPLFPPFAGSVCLAAELTGRGMARRSYWKLVAAFLLPERRSSAKVSLLQASQGTGLLVLM